MPIPLVSNEYAGLSVRRLIAMAALMACGFSWTSATAGLVEADDARLVFLPKPGEGAARLLTPSVIEIEMVSTKDPEPAPVKTWNLVNDRFEFIPPATTDFKVEQDGQDLEVASVGFRRRVLYAPLRVRDLRIGNFLYLKLKEPATEAGDIKISSVSRLLWPASLVASASPMRLSPAIHVNQVGYTSALPKRAIVGYYLGSANELPISTGSTFQIIDAKSEKSVFQGRLFPRKDSGFTYLPTPYQRVADLDFSDLKTPGEYRIVIPGLGKSLPFRVEADSIMAFVRTYALGLYHQRCGTDNKPPFTRFEHEACHVEQAEVPLPQEQFQNAWLLLNRATSEGGDPKRIVGPQLKDEATQLYPILKKGRLDVSGGHHDAGDYSKYTTNSAQLIHFLIFGVDAMPGVASFDNLGLPESGDGVGDILQEAKREADFLAKMQDDDGGFFFLVYPKEREYESNVLPDHGDRQIVWPKNTSATAAAVAALAQCSSSPAFKERYPAEASVYLEKAKHGFEFLLKAIERNGKDGAYQKLTTYGDNFAHNDELAWAACELWLATADERYEQKLFEWFPDPHDPATHRWGWWRMSECWGNATRSYAFAARTHRLPLPKLDRRYLASCENEINAAAQDGLVRSQQCAYGTSFPVETKRVKDAGWYFSNDEAFDITVGYILMKKPAFLNAIIDNLNFEGGCNPVNVCFVAGLGLKRPREMVDQYSQNDGRVLPRSGLAFSNLQAHFNYLDFYKSDLGKLSFPDDGAELGTYPIYDRWSDTFNVATEFTTLNLAKSLVSLACVASMSAPGYSENPQRPVVTIIKNESRSASGKEVLLSVTSQTGSLDTAVVAWETGETEPQFGQSITFVPSHDGSRTIEVEVQWPNGVRAFAKTTISIPTR